MHLIQAPTQLHLEHDGIFVSATIAGDAVNTFGRDGGADDCAAVADQVAGSGGEKCFKSGIVCLKGTNHGGGGECRTIDYPQASVAATAAITTVAARVEVRNDGTKRSNFTITVRVFSSHGSLVAAVSSLRPTVVNGSSTGSTMLTVPVPNATLWSIDAPRFVLLLKTRTGDSVLYGSCSYCMARTQCGSYCVLHGQMFLASQVLLFLLTSVLLLRQLCTVHSRLYTAEVTLAEVVTTENGGISGRDGGGGAATTKRVDAVNITFGIRKIKWDSDSGVAINGQRVELRGVAMHQDLGGFGTFACQHRWGRCAVRSGGAFGNLLPVARASLHAIVSSSSIAADTSAYGAGTAVPDALQEYRVHAMKDLGANAWRCAHNPPNPALLAAADKLGMVVMVENRRFGPYDK